MKEKRLHKQYGLHKGNYLSKFSDKSDSILLCTLDCCLDVEWLSEDTFASAAADKFIYIMRVDEDDAVKTLMYVLLKSVPISD